MILLYLDLFFKVYIPINQHHQKRTHFLSLIPLVLDIFAKEIQKLFNNFICVKYASESNKSTPPMNLLYSVRTICTTSITFLFRRFHRFGQQNCFPRCHFSTHKVTVITFCLHSTNFIRILRRHKINFH